MECVLYRERREGRNQGTRGTLILKAQVSTAEDIKGTGGAAGFAKAQGAWHYKATGRRQEVRLSVDQKLSRSAEQAQGRRKPSCPRLSAAIREVLRAVVCGQAVLRRQRVN